jgi:hypothetical protein
LLSVLSAESKIKQILSVLSVFAVNYCEKNRLEQYMPQIDLNEIDAKIKMMKKTAEELARAGEDFPAIARNIVRISAGIKMLEINISDVIELEKSD